MVQLFAELHARGIAHGDVHPGNFVLLKNGNLRIVDFGNAEPYIDSDTGDHVSHVRFPINPDFDPAILSIYQMDGSRMSRRDDVFRVAEVLIFLFLGDAGPTKSLAGSVTRSTQRLLKSSRRGNSRFLNG